jgi:hypothetical protein
MSSLQSSRTKREGDFHANRWPQFPPAIIDGKLLQSGSACAWAANWCDVCSKVHKKNIKIKKIICLCEKPGYRVY